MSADVSELIAFRDKLEGIQRQKDVVVSAIAKELTARLLRKVKKRTPVKTGTLRRGWTTGNTYNGDSYVVVMVNNNTYYASYVQASSYRVPSLFYSFFCVHFPHSLHSKYCYLP